MLLRDNVPKVGDMRAIAKSSNEAVVRVEETNKNSKSKRSKPQSHVISLLFVLMLSETRATTERCSVVDCP